MVQPCLIKPCLYDNIACQSSSGCVVVISAFPSRSVRAKPQQRAMTPQELVRSPCSCGCPAQTAPDQVNSPSSGDAATGSQIEQEDVSTPANSSADALQPQQGPVPANGCAVREQPLDGDNAKPGGGAVTASEPDTAAALPEVQLKGITMQPATETQQVALPDPEGTAHSTAATQAEVTPEPEQKTSLQAHPLAQPMHIAGTKGAATSSAAGQSAPGSGNVAATALSEMAMPASREQAPIASGGPSDRACADIKSASHEARYLLLYIGSQ